MKILLATDGSDTARAAVDFLVGFPLPSTAEFTVVTVIKEVLQSEQLLQLPSERQEAFDRARQAADEEARILLDTEVARLRRAGFKADGVVRTGRPAEEIVRLASEQQSALIAVGSHGLSVPRRFLLGSVSDRVFEYAPCSVLIVKDPAASGGRTSTVPRAGERWRLLLAFDDSPTARKAVEWCSSMPLGARAEVKAVTVLPMIRMYRQDIRQEMSWVWQEKRQAAEMALQWAAAELDGNEVSVATELVEESDVSQAVLDSAKAYGSDLVVVGHKGKTAFERFLLGSVTARVAHHADCSVLSVQG